MLATKSSRKPPRSRTRTPRNYGIPDRGWIDVAVVFLAAAVLGAGAAWWFSTRGYLLWYGDALAHLNIARRVVDGRTPGLDQIGTVWLPLPHLLMLPFVQHDDLWRSGLAAAIPSVACFVPAAAFFYAALKRVLHSRIAAVSGTLLLALNPNLLYLQSTAMTEPVFLAALSALFYFTVLFRRTQCLWSVAGAAAASTAASMTRYEGWFLIPFVAGYFLWAGERRRVMVAALFGGLAVLWPLAWLGHNWWHYGNALEFYNGRYSAKGIYQAALDQGMARYPGDHEWGKAQLYYRSAARLSLGLPLLLIGLAGAVAALWNRRFWPFLLLLLPAAFYVWSIYSSGTPIFVPTLWPHSFYNTRYGLSILPLVAFLGASLVMLAPARTRAFAGLAVVLVALLPWISDPRPEAWICWKESQVNSESRRAWTSQAAAYMKEHYRPGDGILMGFGDQTGILLEAGIPLRETVHDGNNPQWMATLARPELHLREEWAIAISGDPVAQAIFKLRRTPLRYERVRMIAVKGAPVIEIYRRNRPLPLR